MVGNLVNPETIGSLKEEIFYLWELYQIDKLYQDAFMRCLSGLQPKMYIQILAKEIENLHNEKATMQQIFISIQQREDCIGVIEKISENLNSEEEIKKKATIELEKLRMVSLLVVENIMRFRNQLKSINFISGNEKKLTELENIPIMYNGTNYLIKMKTDTNFLAKSELNQWFNFSNKIDPFLVTPSTPYIVSKGVSKYCLK